MKERSAVISLKNMVVAKYSEDETGKVTYAAPSKIAGAINVKLSTKGESVTQDADGVAGYLKIDSFGGADVEIEASDLSYADRAMLFGKEFINGVIIDKGSDNSPEFAFGFETPKSNGKSRLVWLLRGSFTEGDEDNKTKGEKVEFQTAKVKGKFSCRPDDVWRFRVDEDATGVKGSLIASWFTKVPTVEELRAPAV